MNSLKIKIFTLVLNACVCCSTAAQTTSNKTEPAPSKAHERSAKFIIDPAYSATAAFPFPLTKTGASWLYGYCELQCWRLQLLRQEGIDAKLNVGYPGEYHKAYNQATFTWKNSKSVLIRELRFFSNGAAKIICNGKPIFSGGAKNGEQTIALDPAIAIHDLEFDLSTYAEPPCLLIKEGQLNTNSSNWRWKTADEPLQAPEQFPQLSNGSFPHQSGAIELNLKPVGFQNNLYDFGREILGYVYVESGEMPTVCVGESIAETNQVITARSLEQTMELTEVVSGKWRSKVPLAFRYVRINSSNVKSVSSGILFYPAQYKGAFACSDTLLNRIWMNSAYTLRLCRNDFLCDGIKRDRLPWAGDLAMSMMVNAYTFGDKQPVQNSLAVLNRAGIKNQDINGIIDYDLWWLISEHQYQIYYKDPEHLSRQWERIKETMDVLKAKCDTLGFINVKNAKWLFIDWVKVNKTSALQVLWWWAQESAVALALRMGDPGTASRWQSEANRLKMQLIQKVWDAQQGAWMDDPYFPKEISRHANILAVVSGLSGPGQYWEISKILQARQAHAVGTPYMSGFEDLALAKLGEEESAITDMNRIWGGMLSQPGTTTFWEAYSPAEKNPRMFSFYSRPFGKSLCHAWSSGPAALLPAVILGIHPLSDGWETFTLDPKPGKLSWVSAAIPTPKGAITIDIVKNNMTMNVPAGITAKWKKETFKGPLNVTREL